MPRFHDDLLSSVISESFRAFSLPEKVKPIYIRDVWLKRLDDWDSAPGLPWTQYGYKTKADVACDPHAMRQIMDFWHCVQTGRNMHIPHCAAPIRLKNIQQKNKKPIKMVMWGYPCTASFQEVCFMVPLIEGYKRIITPIAYGFDDLHHELYLRFHRYCHFVNLDYRNFGKRVPDWLIQIACDVLSSNINWIVYENHKEPHGEKLHKVWMKLVDNFIRTPVHFRHGVTYKKQRGVGSGSYFTELVYSIVNYIVIQYSVRAQNLEVCDQMVLGDETLFATSGPIDLSLLCATVGKFDMVINLDGVKMFGNIREVKFLGKAIGTMLNEP